MISPRAHVLVVDDEKLIRWSVGERLTRNGFDVTTCESAEAALEVLLHKKPDVALFDVRLPGLDGVGLLTRALALHPDLVVVMMSAHSSVDTAVQAMKDGALDFLVKPFPLTQLDTVVERALASSASRRQLAESMVSRPTEDKQGTMVGSSPAFLKLVATLDRLAASPIATVLILGESGTGKERVARGIHFRSARASKPFLQINCAAMPEQLLESELFGHERGAFTDAHTRKLGLFEEAEGGTVLLDEIGDLPPAGQAKLLRLLEEKTFRRVGGSGEISVDVRVLAATNVNLEERVRDGEFRNDLFFRLNVIRVEVPPMRERREDVGLLAAHFMARVARELGRLPPRGVSPAALELMQSYQWPGNVRELRNVIERALILHPAMDELRPEHLPAELAQRPAATPATGTAAAPAPGAPEGAGPLSLGETERRLILEALEKARGNQTQAARLLGITRDTLRYRLKKHGLAG